MHEIELCPMTPTRSIIWAGIRLLGLCQRSGSPDAASIRVQERDGTIWTHRTSDLSPDQAAEVLRAAHAVSACKTELASSGVQYPKRRINPFK